MFICCMNMNDSNKRDLTCVLLIYFTSYISAAFVLINNEFQFPPTPLPLSQVNLRVCNLSNLSKL